MQKIFYKKSGHGPTVLLLHGLFSSHHYWHNLTNILEKNYTIYGIDLLGFGDSPKPVNCNYAIDDQVESIEAFVIDHKLTNFILIGHSMGATIATRYAYTHQNQVEQLILCNLPLLPEDISAEQWIKQNHLAPKFLVSGKLAEFVCKSSHHVPFLSKLIELFPSKVPVEVRSDVLKHTWQSYSKSLKNVMEKYNPKADLNNLKTATTLLLGGKDTIAKVSALPPYLKKKLHLVVVEEADHQLPLFYPEEIVKIIKRGKTMKDFILIERTINAPIERVFKAFTTQEDLVMWHHAGGGWQTPYAVVNSIVGGKQSIAYANPEGKVEFEIESEFTTVEKPNKLSYTFGDRNVVIDFEELDGKTRMHMRIDIENENNKELQLKGWSEHIDNLEKYLEDK